jgi:hypothetical protein
VDATVDDSRLRCQARAPELSICHVTRIESNAGRAGPGEPHARHLPLPVSKSGGAHAGEDTSHLGANHVMQLVVGLALWRPATAFRLAGHQLVYDRHELLVDEPLGVLL